MPILLLHVFITTKRYMTRGMRYSNNYAFPFVRLFCSSLLSYTMLKRLTSHQTSLAI